MIFMLRKSIYSDDGRLLLEGGVRDIYLGRDRNCLQSPDGYVWDLNDPPFNAITILKVRRAYDTRRD